MSNNNFDEHELGGEAYVDLPGITSDISPVQAAMTAFAIVPPNYDENMLGNDTTTVPADYVPQKPPEKSSDLPEGFDPYQMWARYNR